MGQDFEDPSDCIQLHDENVSGYLTPSFSKEQLSIMESDSKTRRTRARATNGAKHATQLGFMSQIQQALGHSETPQKSQRPRVDSVLSVLSQNQQIEQEKVALSMLFRYSLLNKSLSTLDDSKAQNYHSQSGSNTRESDHKQLD